MVYGSLDKIQIDPRTRLYVSTTDGRIHMFHGLAIEDSSPPWTLATYTDEQIELMKSVSSELLELHAIHAVMMRH